MKKVYFLLMICFSILLLTVSSFASTIKIYVDAAPNVYGSPDYPPWQTTTFAAVADGSFINMSNGINPSNIGTTNFEIQDELVYSFGDLGSRLTWIYWVPDATVADLKGNFKISLLNYWGTDPVWDFYDDYYGSTWLEPASWVDYDDGLGHTGVIGAAGMAYWPSNQAELDAGIIDWGAVKEDWVFTVALNGEEVSLTSYRAPIPEPATLLLLGFGLLGVAGVSRRKN
ncbi:MAG: PEP-CTERM sorting domain-containing protein [Desulfobacula sp.]